MDGITQISDRSLQIDKGYFDLTVTYLDGDILFRWDEIIDGFNLNGYELKAISDLVNRCNSKDFNDY